MKTARPIDIALSVWLSTPGRDQTSLALKLGVDPQHITNWKNRGLPASRHAAVAKALGISVDQLLGIKPLRQAAGPRVSGDSLINYDAASKHAQSMGRLSVSETLRAELGGQLATTRGDDAPAGFIDVHQVTPGLLAVRVRGDGLSPAIEDGEILIIDAHASAQAGERVLLTLANGQRFCKRLLFERDDAVSIADLSTKQTTTIARADMVRIQPIIAVYSANRWVAA